MQDVFSRVKRLVTAALFPGATVGRVLIVPDAAASLGYLLSRNKETSMIEGDEVLHCSLDEEITVSFFFFFFFFSSCAKVGEIVAMEGRTLT